MNSLCFALGEGISGMNAQRCNRERDEDERCGRTSQEAEGKQQATAQLTEECGPAEEDREGEVALDESSNELSRCAQLAKTMPEGEGRSETHA